MVGLAKAHPNYNAKNDERNLYCLITYACAK